jgi:hypothetical protein
MVFLLLVAVGLAFLRPGMFSVPASSLPPPAASQTPAAPIDSGAAPADAPAETMVTTVAGTTPVPPAPASAPAPVAGSDSTSRLWKELQNRRAEVLQLTAQLEAERRQTDSLRTMRTAAAKLLNAMNAEDAARILGNVTDEEARDILMLISTRHAGKILSALDPGRAATILR